MAPSIPSSLRRTEFQGPTACANCMVAITSSPHPLTVYIVGDKPTPWINATNGPALSVEASVLVSSP